ncbi:hypothetical protein Tco_1269926, partial [Tanacetum coccineum]
MWARKWSVNDEDEELGNQFFEGDLKNIHLLIEWGDPGCGRFNLLSRSFHYITLSSYSLESHTPNSILTTTGANNFDHLQDSITTTGLSSTLKDSWSLIMNYTAVVAEAMSSSHQ